MRGVGETEARREALGGKGAREAAGGAWDLEVTVVRKISEEAGRGETWTK